MCTRSRFRSGDSGAVARGELGLVVSAGFPPYRSGVKPGTADRKWTLEDLEAMPEDGYLYELHRGLLLSEPAPGSLHGIVSARIAYRLEEHARGHGRGLVMTNDSGFVLERSPDTVRGPDVAYVARERFARQADPVRAFHGPPDLAVEVRSPSNTARGIAEKVTDYLDAGTSEVWVVDPGARTVTTHAAGREPIDHVEDALLRSERVLPGFELRIAELFEI